MGGLGDEIDQMRTALGANDLARLAVLAHRLKGAAGSYGFPVITEHAAALEKQAKAAASTGDLAVAIERITLASASARVSRGL